MADAASGNKIFKLGKLGISQYTNLAAGPQPYRWLTWESMGELSLFFGEIVEKYHTVTFIHWVCHPLDIAAINFE